MEEVVVVPECSPELKPVVGQKFLSLDFAFAFYDVYADAVGFDTRKQGIRKTDDVTTRYYVVCNREGKKKSNEDDQLNARYIIQDFNEVHNHYMVESRHQYFMALNRMLDDVHHKFILDCSKANIGPTLTFKVLKEILCGFKLIGCTVGDIRNASRDIKAYTHGFDVQMVLDDMAKKREMYCMIFTPFTGKDNHRRPVTFAAEVVCNEKTGAFAWLFKHFVECMGVAPKMTVTNQDLGMRSTIEEVLVGTRHRWCMWHIMHKLATRVPNKLLRDEDFKKEFNACVWSDLLEPDEFEKGWNGVVERRGLEDFDWFNTLYDYMQFWIPRNSRIKLDYHDAIALPILATALPFEKHASTLYTDSMFKKIQEEIVEGNDRCRVLGFSSTDMVDTYKLGDINRNSYFVSHDKTADSYSCECKLFGRQGYLCSHIFFLFRNNEMKKIPDKYCENRWMKTSLAMAVHEEFDDALPTRSIVDDRQTVSNQGISMFYGFLRRFETNIDVLRAFVGGVEELGNSLQAGTPTTSTSEKRRMIEEFYGMVRPDVVEVHPPDVVKTKGHASSSASRLISKREKAIKEATRPLRLCKACDEMSHHDSRNCPMLTEMAKEKELRKGKRKC
ncbi:protein FAR1-RELATED SEQUENCE 5-like [Salvia splendens]|uniref:protein FAR1-RELATED SEQUENCE 5-like n=1 Tax=Salvia splendens TaxID=180675 RepID=UPI001C25E220|nr:protein FAR1-RELATED SEQUENCE 5-like [Salvia splendens]